MPGRSLELYFVDGKPNGMLPARILNWTGHALRLSRTRIAEGLKRAMALKDRTQTQELAL